jgi:hypothetical protein
VRPMCTAPPYPWTVTGKPNERRDLLVWSACAPDGTSCGSHLGLFFLLASSRI